MPTHTYRQNSLYFKHNRSIDRGENFSFLEFNDYMTVTFNGKRTDVYTHHLFIWVSIINKQAKSGMLWQHMIRKRNILDYFLIRILYRKRKRIFFFFYSLHHKTTSRWTIVAIVFTKCVSYSFTCYTISLFFCSNWPHLWIQVKVYIVE
jgi:hypothetical protein